MVDKTTDAKKHLEIEYKCRLLMHSEVLPHGIYVLVSHV